MSLAVNRVTLIGNLGKDPEIKFTPSGIAVARFPLATSSKRKDAEGNLIDQTEWHNIVLWRRQAEVAGEYLKKGMMVYIEGRIQTRSWEDDQSQKRYITEIIGERMQMFPRRAEGEQAAAPAKEKTEETPPEEEEDLPF